MYYFHNNVIVCCHFSFRSDKNKLRYNCPTSYRYELIKIKRSRVTDKCLKLNLLYVIIVTTQAFSDFLNFLAPQSTLHLFCCNITPLNS